MAKIVFNLIAVLRDEQGTWNDAKHIGWNNWLKMYHGTNGHDQVVAKNKTE